jgi:hypothetical protein
MKVTTREFMAEEVYSKVRLRDESQTPVTSIREKKGYCRNIPITLKTPSPDHTTALWGRTDGAHL